MDRPLWISHRGLCENAVENTAKAFSHARMAGFTHLETDLRLTADGHVVFSHDRDLRRLTGKTIVLNEEKRSALENIRYTDGSGLLFWEEWLETYSLTSWTFDLKAGSALGVIDFLHKWMVRENKEDFFRDNVRFVCWSKHHEAYLKQRIPFAQAYARRFECYRAGIASLVGLKQLGGVIRGRVYAIPPKLAGIPLFRRRILSFYQEQGAQVVAFLPRPGKETALAMRVGCDEILTNYRPVPKSNSSAQ